MAENFTNLRKETDTQIHEAAKVSNKMNPNRLTPTYIIIKSSKVKDKGSILKAARKKAICYAQGNFHMTVSTFFSSNFSGQKGMA